MTRHIYVSMLLCGIITAAGGQEFEIVRHTIDGGGVIHSTGGAFELSGTIGQPDAGMMSAGSFELVGGFWFQIPPSDCNDDGLVNLVDHSALADCLTGPGNGLAGGCGCFDVNQDGAVDLLDLAAAQLVFSGP